MAEPFAPSPSVTGVNPNIGTTLGGDSVSITGSKLGGATAVDFGAVTAEFEVNSDSSITAISPPQEAGTVDVRVTTQNTSAITSADQFTYKAPPEITDISPNSGQPGTEVTITGSSFSEVDSVTFGDVAASFVIDSDTSITAEAPQHPNGAVVVTISTPDGNSAISDADAFTYTGAVSPDLTGVTIPHGDALSSALDCTLKHPLLIFMPEGWDSALLSFCISLDDVVYSDLYNDNKEVIVNVTPRAAIVLDPKWFVVGCYIKFRAGTTSGPVPQSDDRTFMVVMSDR